MNKYFNDGIIAVKAKKEKDLPVFFMGTVSKKGVTNAPVKMKDGTELACCKFSICLYDRKGDVDYVLKRSGLTDEAIYRSAKDDYLYVVCFGESAKFAETLKPGMQVCGGGVIRQKDGKASLLVSGLLKPIKEPVHNDKGRYERYGFDALRPIFAREGQTPVVFASGKGKFWDASEFDSKGRLMKSAHPQLPFYKQRGVIQALEDAMGCNSIAYENGDYPCLRATVWNKDVEWSGRVADNGQLLGCGALQKNSFGEKSSLELNVSSLTRTFGVNAPQTGSATKVSTPVTEKQAPAPVAEPVKDAEETDESFDMYLD